MPKKIQELVTVIPILGTTLRVFENRVLRRIFGTKRKRHENGEMYIMRSFSKYYEADQIKETEIGFICSMHIVGENIKFQSKNLKVRENLEDLG
jgi:hypothetical protein